MAGADSETAAADKDDDLTQLVIPDDALSFNDSLDEGVDPNALADHAALPAESAAAEPVPQDGNSCERPSRDLDDYLDVEDGNETQLGGDITQVTVVTTNTTDADGALTEKKVAQVKFSPKANTTCDEKKSDSSPQGEQPSSESASSKAVGIKMKPSFGKKKKVFMPPKMVQNLSSALPNCVSGQSGSDVSNKSAPQNAELADTSEDQSALGNYKTPTTSSAEDKGREKVAVKVTQDLEKNEECRKAEKEKKKGFTPPKVAKKVSTKCQSDIDTQPSTTADDVDSDNCNSPQVPESIVGKQAECTKEKLLGDAGNSLTPSASPKASLTGDKGEKKQNKNVLQEQRKKEKERERAQKKQEKEQKKLEREKKKAEIEHQREEKRLELERKKAEREQKKIDKELQKIQREQKKAEKLTKQSQKRKQSENKLTTVTDASDSEVFVKKNGEDDPCKSKEDVREDKSSAAQLESTVGKKSESSRMNSEVSCGQNVLEDKNQEQLTEVSCVNKETQACSVQEFKYPKASEKSESGAMKSETQVKASGEQQKQTTNEVEDVEKENVPSDDVQSSVINAVIDDSSDKIPVVVLSPVADNFSETSGSEIKKEKVKSVKKFNPPMSKQKVNTKSYEVKKQRKERDSKRDIDKSSETKKKQAGKGKKRKSTDCDDEPEAKRSIPANYHGPVWVQCENSSCMKWRLLKDCDDPATVPSSWVCSMNSDPDHNSCSAEEERWSDPGDSQEFVESPYIPGSIVWSKMDGYPWLVAILIIVSNIQILVSM